MNADAQQNGSSDILDQLGRILVSQDFDASGRNRRFLEYVVHETLDGRSDRIKAYNIATSVLGRGDNFDPQQDAIVRIEAGRLRRSLERYYLTSGAKDRVRITIPTGSYVPVFALVAEAGSGTNTVAASKPYSPSRSVANPIQKNYRPSVFVMAFEEEGDHSAFPNFTRGFTRHLIAGLTRFTDLLVFGPETVPGLGGTLDLGRVQHELDIDFVLTGGTVLTGNRFGVEALLIDARTGRYLWAENLDRDLNPATIIQTRDEVADCVVRAIALPYGVMFGAKAREAEGKQPESLRSFDQVIRFHHYRRSLDQDLLNGLHAGLEKAIVDDPLYAEAYACLSQVYTDSHRFRHPVGATGNPLLRASDLAHRAIELAPNSSRGYFALSFAQWFSGDLSACIASLETGLTLNPNDTELLSELGLRYASQCNWDKAVPLIESSYARNPGQPGSYRIGLSLWHFAFGRYADALAEARRINAPKVVYGNIMIAVSATRLGHPDEAATAIRDILAIDPDYGSHVMADLGRRSLAPELIDMIVTALHDAGLPPTDGTFAPTRTRKGATPNETHRTGTHPVKTAASRL